MHAVYAKMTGFAALKPVALDPSVPGLDPFLLP
jgi:hypothetical protein